MFSDLPPHSWQDRPTFCGVKTAKMIDPAAQWLAAMHRGDFAAAFRVNEAVLAARDPAARDDPRLPYHLRWVWDGRPFEGRDVLVRCYHGLGDTLQFARYLPALRKHVRSLTLEAPPSLMPLLASLPGIDRLAPFLAHAPLPPSDCDLEIMELPFALKLSPDAIRPPYIKSAPAPLPKGTVGLCWQAGDWDLERSLPSELLAPLTSQPCITLQTEPSHLNVLNPEGCPKDMVTTAALIAGLDLLVTVDTMVAHLAGAMGVPAWLLLKYDADWRWLKDRSDSPWYPSLRLYRQDSPGDWQSAVAPLMRDFAQIRQDAAE
jgi:hypothetical protein